LLLLLKLLLLLEKILLVGFEGVRNLHEKILLLRVELGLVCCNWEAKGSLHLNQLLL
jgi:hypothetical protein